jgi:hypothetical protein
MDRQWRKDWISDDCIAGGGYMQAMSPLDKRRKIARHNVKHCVLIEPPAITDTW